MPQWCYGCLLVVVALISGCGDPVENAIEGLIAGGDQAEKARMELNLAKRAAIAPLIAAFADEGYPPRARVDTGRGAVSALFARGRPGDCGDADRRPGRCRAGDGSDGREVQRIRYGGGAECLGDE